jgi:hypothetical protein
LTPFSAVNVLLSLHRLFSSSHDSAAFPSGSRLDCAAIIAEQNQQMGHTGSSAPQFGVTPKKPPPSKILLPISPPERPAMRVSQPSDDFHAAEQALKLKGRLIPPKKLLGRIASVYARKILLDQTDDRNGRCCCTVASPVLSAEMND